MQRSSLLRRLLALALAAAAVLALSSCGKDEPAPTEPDTPPAVTDEEPVPGQAEEPSNGEVPDLSQDILSMHEKHDDVVGWLNKPDTTINNAISPHYASENTSDSVTKASRTSTRSA